LASVEIWCLALQKKNILHRLNTVRGLASNHFSLLFLLYLHYGQENAQQRGRSIRISCL
jgi:hypothetical protein